MGIPDRGYLGNPARDDPEMQQAFEDQNDVIRMMIGVGLSFQDLTVAAGVINPLRGSTALINVRGQGGAADDLDRIETANWDEGMVLFLKAANEVITVRNGIDNIKLLGGNFVIRSPFETLTLFRLGSDWLELTRNYDVANATSLLELQARIGLTIGSDVQAFDALIPKTDEVNDWFVQQRLTIKPMVGAPSYTWDLDTIPSGSMTLTGNSTLANPTNLKSGGYYSLAVIQDATGGHSLTFGTAYNFPSDSDPLISSLGPNRGTLLNFFSPDGIKLWGAAAEDYA